MASSFCSAIIAAKFAAAKHQRMRLARRSHAFSGLKSTRMKVARACLAADAADCVCSARIVCWVADCNKSIQGSDASATRLYGGCHLSHRC
eukprot:2616461-Amphidinium_carterae.1